MTKYRSCNSEADNVVASVILDPDLRSGWPHYRRPNAGPTCARSVWGGCARRDHGHGDPDPGATTSQLKRWR